jgi:indolepyruvate ferredoxin oxidoreductase
LIDKMRHAAGPERMSTCDAQALATRFLGDTIGANILMLGYAWQLGLVPVSFAALMRAIELNNVAVTMNQLAFSIGRMAAEDPAALESLWQARHLPKQAARVDTLDELITHREGRLQIYGGAAYVKRYRALVDAARRAERAVNPQSERVTRAVATTFYRLLAVKDEYEVARLHTDAAFREALEAQFEGVAGKDFGIKFNLAPPTLTRAQPGVNPTKKVFGQWMWPVLGMMAKWRGLRGTLFDPFGRTLERRMERELADDYETTLQRALAKLNANNLEDVAKLADLHARVRGYGHVKLANLAGVKRGERDLAASLLIDAATGEAVKKSLQEMKGAGQLRGIPVVVAK